MNMYQVVKTSDKSVVAEGFAKREDAKKVRDEKAGGSTPNGFTVSRGSDHPRGPSNGHVEKSKRWV